MITRTSKVMVREARSVNLSSVEEAVNRNDKLIQASLAVDENLKRFADVVAGIKKVAPRSDEFIYFVCRAIHAMEAANLDPVTGQFTGDGRVDEKGRWVSASGKVPFPYVNQNGDAFPEAELLKVLAAAKDGQPEKRAYHTFIGRGLFVNHASDDAEKIRGIILDATWDPKTKGVDLLVACDKIAYPELARQIQAGYSNDVSMGTQVSYSVCSECGNSAKTEEDYCDHIKTAKGSFFNGRPVYEANFGLNFIEISVVGTGADPKAKIRQVLAHLNRAVAARSQRLAAVKETGSEAAQSAEADRLSKELTQIKAALQKLASAENLEQVDITTLGIDLSDNTQIPPSNPDDPRSLKAEVENLKQHLAQLQLEIKNIQGVQMATTDRKAYLNKDGEPDSGLNTTEQDKAEFKQDYKKVRDTQDKQQVGKGMESGDTGMHPGYGESDEAVKKRLMRAEEIAARKSKREALMKSIAYLNKDGEPDSGLNTTEQDKAEFKQDYKKVRDTQDKQMVGKGMESGDTGMHPGVGESDESVKKRLMRATKLKARLLKAANTSETRWVVLAGEEPLLEATASQLYGDELNKPNSDNPKITNLQWVTSADYGRNLIAAIRELGIDEVKKQIEAASSCSKMNKDKLSDQTKDKKEEKKEEKKPVKKAQAETGAVEGVAPPAELPAEGAMGETAAAKPKDEKEGEEGAQVDINIDVDEGEAKAGAELPADVASALSDVSEQIASIGEQLSSILGGAEGAMDEIAGEAKDLGEEIVDTGEELTGLDDAMAAASKAEEAAPEGSPEEEKAIEAKKQLSKLVEAAVADARTVAAKGQAFLKKVASKKAPETLEARRAARKAIAEKLYNLTDGDMTSEAHPKSNKTAVPGHEVKTGHGIKEAAEAVATKNPTGKLTAAQKQRRIEVASFIKGLEAQAEKKPDADGDGVPDWADKCPGKDDAECKKEAAAEKTEVKADAKVEAKVEAKAEAKTEVKAAADAEAKKYYNELYNSDAEAKAFAKDLTKDHSSRKASADSDKITARMHSAYKVALRQASLGQIQNTAEAVQNQVNTLVAMDDHGFEAFAKAVEATAQTSRKTVEAAATSGSTLRAANAQIPPQGDGVQDPKVAASQARVAAVADLSSRLSNLGWSVKGRR